MTKKIHWRDAFRRTSATVALCLSMAVSAYAQEDAVTLNFVNADIDSVVKAVGEVTGKNFIIDPRVKGQINVISSKPISRAQVYDALLAALRSQGFTAVESGGFVRILPEADAKVMGAPVGKAKGDKMVTQIFKLHHESAAQAVNVLRPLIPANSSITASPGTNSLVITDYAANLDSIAKIIASIDRPAGDNIEIIPVKHMSAIDLATTLNQIFGEGTSSGGGGTASVAGATGSVGNMTIVPEPRSNTLIIRGASPSRLASIYSLIAKLDSAMGATGNIHVVYLKNSEAVKLAAVLRSVINGNSSSFGSLDDSSTSSSFSQGMLGLSSGSSSTGSGSSTGMSNVASSLGNSFNNSSSSDSYSSLLNSGGSGDNNMIQADPMTNTLIINAPDPIYRNLRAVIDLLDVRRAQVFVESLIVEVTSEKASEFGIQWQFLQGYDRSGKQVIGGTNFGSNGQGNILNVSQDLTAAGSGLNIGIIDGTVNIPGIGEITNLGFLARALEADGKTNILSTPNLLTLDNEEATIVVGQNVPIMTGSYAQTGTSTSVSPFQTYDREDVGLTLKIKPQISESGTVRLQIYQEVSSVATTTMDGGIVTNKRALESNVLVDDGQIVVLGGLVQDSFDGSVDKVPFLGDVPVVGWLFKSESRRRAKTNLMVFLRPYILRDPRGSENVTNTRYDYITGVQRKAKPEDTPFFNKEMTAPQMPERPDRRQTLFPPQAQMISESDSNIVSPTEMADDFTTMPQSAELQKPVETPRPAPVAPPAYSAPVQQPPAPVTPPAYSAPVQQPRIITEPSPSAPANQVIVYPASKGASVPSSTPSRVEPFIQTPSSTINVRVAEPATLQPVTQPARNVAPRGMTVPVQSGIAPQSNIAPQPRIVVEPVQSQPVVNPVIAPAPAAASSSNSGTVAPMQFPRQTAYEVLEQQKNQGNQKGESGLNTNNNW